MWTPGRPRAGAWALLAATMALLLLAAEHTVADAQAPTRDVSPAIATRYTSERTTEQLIADAFGKESPSALNVARCESRFENVRSPQNANRTYDWGIFQLNDGGTLQELGGAPALALIPDWNVSAAHRLWQRHGWKRWRCRPDGTRR